MKKKDFTLYIEVRWNNSGPQDIIVSFEKNLQICKKIYSEKQNIKFLLERLFVSRQLSDKQTVGDEYDDFDISKEDNLLNVSLIASKIYFLSSRFNNIDNKNYIRKTVSLIKIAILSHLTILSSFYSNIVSRKSMCETKIQT